MEKFEFEIFNVPDKKIGKLQSVILEKCPTLVENLKLTGMTLRD